MTRAPYPPARLHVVLYRTPGQADYLGAYRTRREAEQGTRDVREMRALNGHPETEAIYLGMYLPRGLA